MSLKYVIKINILNNFFLYVYPPLDFCFQNVHKKFQSNLGSITLYSKFLDHRIFI